MPQFAYVSRDAQGQRITAVAQADSRRALLNQLKTRGLTVIEIQELDRRGGAAAGARYVGRAPTKGGWTLLLLRSSVSLGDLAVFWRELATMIAAGLPVVEALESIAEEMDHAGLRAILGDVINRMWEGAGFAQAIQHHQKAFSPMVIALIGAAEESGSLAEISEQLATFLEDRDRLIRKVKAALTYPVFLCCFFLIVMAVATFWLIPKFREIYEGFHAKLPWITEVVFAINAFILQNFPWLLAGSAAGVTALLLWAKRPSGRAVLDRLMLRIPIFGELIRRASVARFARSMSILLTGGIPINRALEMAQETAGNTVVAKAIRESREDILKGGKIAGSLKKQKIFPHMMVRMVSAGEETGSLAKLLEKVSQFYEQRVDASLTTINSLIEPILIVVIGGFVLIFVLALYMPIFKLAMTMRG